MSLIDDRDVSRSQGRDASVDRRRPTSGPRLSWASERPFEAKGPLPAPKALGSGWREHEAAYQMSTLARDLVLCTSIPTLLLFLLHGVSLLQLGWGVVIGLVFVAMVAFERGYERSVLTDGRLEFEAVFRGGVLTAAVLALLAVGLDIDVPRTIVFGALPLIVAVLITSRQIGRRLLHRRRAQGAAMRRTLVVGDAVAIEHVVTDLRSEPAFGYEISGVCVPEFSCPLLALGIPVLGTLSDIVQVVVDGAFDVVIVTGSELSGQALRRLSWALDRTGTELVVAPGIVEVFGPRVVLEPTAGLSLIHVSHAESRRSRLLLKRGFDTAAAGGLLLVLSPLMLVIGLAVKLTSPGPVLFRQSRVGKAGVEFPMLKFRSMVVDAEDQLAALLERNQADGPLFKLEDDPRVTRVGRFLRKHSLDELPQLLNVVRGQMALVGPRPPLPSEVQKYGESMRRRLLVKPGVTGLWQVSGRADLPWDEAVKLDLRYVENWSITFDLVLLWRTLSVVMSGHGGR
ncbi:MAG TPA: sugar transferase [Cellulomonas sp.]